MIKTWALTTRFIFSFHRKAVRNDISKSCDGLATNGWKIVNYPYTMRNSSLLPLHTLSLLRNYLVEKILFIDYIEVVALWNSGTFFFQTFIRIEIWAYRCIGSHNYQFQPNQSHHVGTVRDSRRLHRLTSIARRHHFWAFAPGYGCGVVCHWLTTVRPSVSVFSCSFQTGRTTYPLIYVSPAGSISIILAHSIIIEMSIDRCVRVVCHDKFAVSASSS